MAAGHPANVDFARRWRDDRGLAQHDVDWYDDEEGQDQHSFDGDLSIWHERYRDGDLMSFEREEYAQVFPQLVAPRTTEPSPLDDIATRSWPISQDNDFRVSQRLLQERAPLRTICSKCGSIHEGQAQEGRAWFKAHACSAGIAA